MGYDDANTQSIPFEFKARGNIAVWFHNGFLKIAHIII